MQLSEKACEDLKELLEKEIGIESVLMLSENEISRLGVFFLSTFAESLKIREKIYN